VGDSELDLAELIRELIATNRQVRKTLRRSEIILTKSLERFESGEDPLAILESLLPTQREGSGEDPFKDHARARHRLRLAIIGICLDSGLSIGDIGRLYGFSRQMASRYAREVRDARQETD
jgi:hypothetical protein